MMDRAATMFDELGPDMSGFFGQMRSGRLMDLVCREGKGGGGYCSDLMNFGMPFIFANFNGTMHDVGVFTHEMGHAFQMFASSHQTLEDYLAPTMEACEIHSMGLEFLTWPQMGLFFGDDVSRFQWMHLTQRLTVIPYIALIDHFQHLVYSQPTASADERAALYQELERKYLPWTDWGDLAHPASGRRWQAQLHVFTHPFYYIDYALALACAFQLWVRAMRDREGTMGIYRELCRRGGEVPFGKLVEDAGLVSPFDEGCWLETVEQARRELAAT
jgi:M3 family oligoendopeptidase